MAVTKPYDPQNFNYDYEAIVNPTVNDDRSIGYLNGARWLNNVTLEMFVLVDNTPGAAIWTSITSGGAASPFSIDTFSDGQAETQLIGSGTAISSITFTASYNEGPATGGSVALITGTDLSGAFPISMLGPTYVSSGAVAVSIQYPVTVGGVVRFRLTALKGAESDTADETITFVNQIIRGVMTSPLPGAGTFTQTDLDDFFTTRTLSTTVDISYIAASGAGEYDVIAFREALGAPLMFINGLLGDFDDRGTVTFTNGAGFAETYHVYALPQENETGAFIEWLTP